ncbi:Tn3 family transposase [Streptomyces avidinii]|uniref:Tn3 transposase DDE domain-containing protein n=1 Tax=Streptomyces avidinii TaxID=1895 RepID=A0ABS4KXH7_STRAV|nr:Tn3 family transposase [Streptomyces avidinii]MBP2034728.1 hypothetical protein [Streptomyces avidinii]GGY88447.1 hypothetical protein GCM10010343_11990 [Streptomyces avidinii]
MLSTETIDWDLISQQYDQIMKYATACVWGPPRPSRSCDGDLADADKKSQEDSMLALHLLQSALVHVNTLLMQEVLADPKWADKLTDADRPALSPRFWTHVNPYGRFELDMNSCLDLDLSLRATVPGRTPRTMRQPPPQRDTRTTEPWPESW